MNKKVNYKQAAQQFEPRTMREYQLKKKCKLAVGQEKGTCPCILPTECQLIRILKQEVEDDTEE